MHYYQFNIGDYASHTKGLSLYEDLAYRRLMDEYYLSEQALNGCSTDVARCIGMREQQQEVDYILQRFFKNEDGKWTHKRIEKEIAEFHSGKESKSKAGKASAEARRIKALEQALEQNPTDVEQTLNSVELTKNQEPRTNTDTDVSVAGNISPAPCPHQEIISLYHEIIPTGTAVRVWNSEREKHLRARWRENPKRQNLGWWRKFFEYAAQSEFLTGQTAPMQQGRDPFVVSLDWLINPQNFAKVIEGKYHQRGAA